MWLYNPNPKSCNTVKTWITHNVIICHYLLTNAQLTQVVRQHIFSVRPHQLHCFFFLKYLIPLNWYQQHVSNKLREGNRRLWKLWNVPKTPVWGSLVTGDTIMNWVRLGHMEQGSPHDCVKEMTLWAQEQEHNVKLLSVNTFLLQMKGLLF